MNKFKISIIFLLLSTLLYSTEFNVKKMQKDFHTTVVLKPLYEKYKNKSKVKKAIQKRAKRFRVYNFYWKRAKVLLAKQMKHLKSSQFLSLVDLSNQVLIVVLYDKPMKDFYPIGFDFISSGNIDREKEVKNGEDHYFKTPTGFFNIKSGWRSDGELNIDKFTLPYGEKDRFVFYFGEQDSFRYSTFDKNNKKIKDSKNYKLINGKLKFAMHAHKSTAPLGTPQSHGCIRMSNDLNIYLDNNLVFFKHLYDGKKWTHPYKKPPTKPKHYDLAGEFMLVVDSI
nr:L,D-transpeptidase [uncultured Sulfurimonas sp.]